MKKHFNIFCLSLIILFAIYLNSLSPISSVQNNAAADSKNLKEFYAKAFVPKIDFFSNIGAEFTLFRCSDKNYCSLLDIRSSYNLIDIKQFMLLGVHVGIIDTNNDTNLKNIFVIPFTSNPSVYFGGHFLVDSDYLYANISLSKYEKIAGIRQLLSDIISIDSNSITKNWYLVSAAGLNFLGSANNFFGLSFGLSSCNVDFVNYFSSYKHDSIQLGLLLANTLWSDELEENAFFSRFYIHAGLNNIAFNEIFESITNMEKLRINIGLDMNFVGTFSNFLIGIGYNSTIEEYKNINENFYNNIFGKLSLTLNF